MILVVLEARMAVAVVVVPFLIEFQDMVVVVPAKAVEVAGLHFFYLFSGVLFSPEQTLIL